MRSDNILSFTLPTTGTLPHATGAVHNAAVYAILPLTVGRCGCVEGNRWRLIWGERMSCGSGDTNSVGRRSCKIRMAAIASAVDSHLHKFARKRTGAQLQVALCKTLPLALIELRVEAW